MQTLNVTQKNKQPKTHHAHTHTKKVESHQGLGLVITL